MLGIQCIFDFMIFSAYDGFIRMSPHHRRGRSVIGVGELMNSASARRIEKKHVGVCLGWGTLKGRGSKVFHSKAKAWGLHPGGSEELLRVFKLESAMWGLCIGKTAQAFWRTDCTGASSCR